MGLGKYVMEDGSRWRHGLKPQEFTIYMAVLYEHGSWYGKYMAIRNTAIRMILNSTFRMLFTDLVNLIGLRTGSGYIDEAKNVVFLLSMLEGCSH